MLNKLVSYKFIFGTFLDIKGVSNCFALFVSSLVGKWTS